MKKTMSDLLNQMVEWQAEGFLIQDIVNGTKSITEDYLYNSSEDGRSHLKRAIEYLDMAVKEINEADANN